MGIRYFAVAIEESDFERASRDPCPFCSSMPRKDAWAPAEGRTPTLDLDKCWRELQVLLGPIGDEDPRPALRLVEGNVGMVGYGWIPFERALSADEVRQIAADIALVGDADIRRCRALFDVMRPQDEGEFGYIAYYLGEAQAFVTGLAAAGLALVYKIG